MPLVIGKHEQREHCKDRAFEILSLSLFFSQTEVDIKNDSYFHGNMRHWTERPRQKKEREILVINGDLKEREKERKQTANASILSEKYFYKFIFKKAPDRRKGVKNSFNESTQNSVWVFADFSFDEIKSFFLAHRMRESAIVSSAYLTIKIL